MEQQNVDKIDSCGLCKFLDSREGMGFCTNGNKDWNLRKETDRCKGFRCRELIGDWKVACPYRSQCECSSSNCPVEEKRKQQEIEVKGW